jgi:RNase H-like domain found in reverse transcriptase/Reverse transcriptase (RNA-dependent DNA polymerase)/Aspartyl protease/Zinc knuckle
MIPNNRKIAVITPRLRGSAATWWTIRRNQNHGIDRWNDLHNQVQSFRPVFIQQFRTAALEAKWFTQLTQRKQLPGEDVDSYHNEMEEIIRRVEAGGHVYPDSTKAQIFVNGLRPEFCLHVSSLTPNNLQDAYNRAKAYENALKQNPTYAALLGFHTTGPAFNMNNSTPSHVPVPINATEAAINKLTEAVTAMMSQVNILQKRETQRPVNNNNNNFNNNNRPRPVCYNCGNVGHILRDCPRPRNRPFNRSNENNLPGNSMATPPNNIPLGNPVQANNNATQNNNNPEAAQTIQALLATIMSQNGNQGVQYNNNNGDQDTVERQDSYFSLHEYQNTPYYPADRGGPSTMAKKDPILTRSKDKGKSKGESQPDYPQVVVEFQENPNPPEVLTGDVNMDEAPEKEEINRTEKLKIIPKPRKITVPRRKSMEEELPQIASLIPKYSIVADLQNQKANITYGQLLLGAPGMRQDLMKSLQKKKLQTKRKQRTNIGIQPNHKSTALYCDAKVEGKTIPLIVDSGSSGSVVSSLLLQKLGIKVERPSTVNMISVHGESKRAVGEISDFPFEVGSCEIPIDVVVTDARTYQAIVGNDWLSKVKANINWSNSEMIILWNNQKIKVPVEYRKLFSQPLESDRPVIVESLEESKEESDSDMDSDDEFEEEDLEDQLFAHSEIDAEPGESQGEGDYPETASQSFESLEEEFDRTSSETGEDDEIEEIISCYFDEDESPEFLINPELSEELKVQLGTLLQNNLHNFAFSSSQLGRTNAVRHRIYSGDAIPIKQRPYRHSPKEKKFLQEEVERMLEEEIISVSSSPWTSPVVLVKQKDKTRICIDYRKLNTVTKKDNYPLPRIDDLLDMLKNSSWYTSLDLASGYWQVEMNPEDKEKTAFITPGGIYQFNVMPFGLTNAPATFQRLMDSLFSGLIGKSVVVYLDDLNIYSKTFEDHLEHLQEVFNILQKAGLKLKPQKCVFAQKNLKFLGYVVGEHGISTDPAKIEVVKTFPVPKNLRQLRGFLGLASYYRRFVEGFTKIAAPLNELLKKKVRYKWTGTQQQAFERLKAHLTSAPILAYPDFEKEFILFTDASDLALGAILSQVDQKGHERVIAYASRTLAPAEKNYSVTEKECLAVVWAVTYFRQYLHGSHFNLITDHSALKSLFAYKMPQTRLARWIAILQEYTFTTIYKPGKNHSNVDTLSRIEY